MLILGLSVVVTQQLIGDRRPHATSPNHPTDRQTKPQPISKLDGEHWARENDPRSLDDCKKASVSPAFVEGCKRYLRQTR